MRAEVERAGAGKASLSEHSVLYALVDTESDVTLLPLAIAHVLEVSLYDAAGIEMDSAGGSAFAAFPSRSPVQYTLEQRGHCPLQREGVAYFSVQEPVVLLGHQECLEKFGLFFDGPRRRLRLDKP